MVRIVSLHSYNDFKWLRALIGKAAFLLQLKLRSQHESEARGECQPSEANECIESPTGSARTKRYC
jgi:hypothetical protein